MEKNIITIPIIGIFAYLGINQEVFLLYTILLFIDFITGTMKGFVNKNLSSRRAMNGFISKFLLLLLILGIGVFGRINHMDMSHILSGTFMALSLAEMYSILANIYEIRSGKKIKEFDAVTGIIQMALDFIRKKLEKLPDNYHKNDKQK